MCLAEDTKFAEEFDVMKSQRDPIADTIRTAQASADKFMDAREAKLAMFDEMVMIIKSSRAFIDFYANCPEKQLDHTLEIIDGVLDRATKLQDRSK